MKHENSLKLKTKLLIIYPYSISNNLLKEVLLRMGISFILTNEVKKASIILGLKKHLNKNISLVFEPIDVVEAEVDKNMVGTILRNLLSNAIKFTDKGAVHLEVSLGEINEKY